MIYSYALELVGFTHKHIRRSHTTAHTSVSHKTQTQITPNCTYIGFTHKHRRRSHTTAHTSGSHTNTDADHTQLHIHTVT